MIDILLVARNHLLTALRERITLFWFLVFPVFLFVMLALVFGQIGQEGEISFEISLLNLDQGDTNSFSVMIESLFDRLARPAEPEQEPLFQLRKPSDGEDPDAFLDTEILAVRRGRRAALIVISEGLTRRIEGLLAPGGPSTPDGSSAGSLEIYFSEGNATSGMAVSIIDQVLASVDQEILARAGRFDRASAIPQTTTWIGTETGETAYIDFLLPGIVLMGFFMNGLFGVPGAILFSRDQGVLRRYWVTPLTVPRFLAGLSIGHLALCVIQFAILFVVGRFAFGASVSFAAPWTILYMLLAIATFMAFGFLIASVSKTANSGMAIANILNMPMMFLSGLFFPIAGLPVFIRAIVYVNPVSYLADGLRSSTGVDSAAFPVLLTIAVPLGWIALSSAVAAWRLRWDVAP